MLTIPMQGRIYAATARVDGRKGIDGLAALVRSCFHLDPLSGDLFVFFSRRADRVRALYLDRDGYVLVTKRLERGTFRLSWKSSDASRISLEAPELLLLLEGIDVSNARRRARWSRGNVPTSR